MSRVAKSVAQLVRARAQFQCEYCQSQEQYVGEPFTIDHIDPQIAGGADDPANLCLACFACNYRKQARMMALDPDTGQRSRLFNAREDHWSHHFRWTADGTQVIGMTPIGRATTLALQLNHESRIGARTFWVRHGVHPPID